MSNRCNRCGRRSGRLEYCVPCQQRGGAVLDAVVMAGTLCAAYLAIVLGGCW